MDSDNIVLVTTLGVMTAVTLFFFKQWLKSLKDSIDFLRETMDDKIEQVQAYTTRELDQQSDINRDLFKRVNCLEINKKSIQPKVEILTK